MTCRTGINSINFLPCICQPDIVAIVGGVNNLASKFDTELCPLLNVGRVTVLKSGLEDCKVSGSKAKVCGSKLIHDIPQAHQPVGILATEAGR